MKISEVKHKLQGYVRVQGAIKIPFILNDISILYFIAGLLFISKAMKKIMPQFNSNPKLILPCRSFFSVVFVVCLFVCLFV